MSRAGWQRYRLAVQYSGSRFHGWQLQHNGPVDAPGALPTVQGALEAALARVVGAGNVSRSVVAGRTDAGVHALQNVFHVDLVRRERQVGKVLAAMEADTLRRAVNAHLRRADVAVTAVSKVEAGWHARRDARGRVYVYRMLSHPGLARSRKEPCGTESDGSAFPRLRSEAPVEHPVLFERERAWVVPHGLDAAAMQEAAQLFVGTHDFSAFRAAGCQAASPVTTLRSVEVRHSPAEDTWLESAATGDYCGPGASWAAGCAAGYGSSTVVLHGTAFLYHMVRNIVGCLAAVGGGRLQLRDVERLLRGRDRTAAPPMAPAHGLYLARVLYDDDNERLCR